MTIGPQLGMFRVYVKSKTGLFAKEVDRYNQPHAKLLLIVKKHARKILTFTSSPS